MPDILIRGMEMPKHCLECPLRAFDGYDYHCPFMGIDSLSIGRQDDCPLHELPPHGDLIEKDLVLEYPIEWFYDDPYISLSDIKAAPVVVPAERREG